MAQNRGAQLLIIIVIGALLSLVSFYAYNLDIFGGSGSITGLIYLTLVALGVGIAVLMVIGAKTRSLTLENFFIYIIALGIVSGAFVIVSSTEAFSILPPNFSVITQTLGSVVGL